MTSEKCVEWFDHLWGPSCDDVCPLLVIRQVPIHKIKVVTDPAERAVTDTGFVPTGCTGILQPGDMYWKKCFKTYLIRSWEQFTRKGERMPMNNPQKPLWQDMSKFVLKAWSAVPIEAIQQSFNGSASVQCIMSEGGQLYDRLAGVATLPVTEETALEDECMYLIVCSDSRESFRGYSGCDE